MTEKTCLITGVGPGTGSALARRFSEGGYRVAMMARKPDRLYALQKELPGSGVYPCDVADTEKLLTTLAQIRDEMGAPAILVHNAVRGTMGDFLDMKPADLERNFQINTMALVHLGQALAPAMIAAGEGAIICTGNTSAYRGKPNFSGFAPSKAAQRILAEAMARSLGPKGVHVAYVAIDAVIDLEWTRQRSPEKPDDYFCKPADIAAECYRIAHQPKSAWSFDVVIRPFGETW